MKTTLNKNEVGAANKQIGQFKNIEEAAKNKNNIINKMLAKVDGKHLQNLGK
jgi:hypothetical protein